MSRGRHKHWWSTIHYPEYGYVSVCDGCGKRESAEHSLSCAERRRANYPCICGADKEFREYELKSICEESRA